MKGTFHSVKNDAYGVRAVERAVEVLAALAEADQPQTLSAIAARAELSVATTFRLVRTLQDRGLVMPNGELGRYTLGFRVLELAHALARQLDIIAISRPFLVAVRDQVNETTGLTVRTGDHWAHAEHAEALQPVRRVMEIGDTAPLYAGCAGKVFLAAASDEEIEAYLNRNCYHSAPPLRPMRRFSASRSRQSAVRVSRKASMNGVLAASVSLRRSAPMLDGSSPRSRFPAPPTATRQRPEPSGSKPRLKAHGGFRQRWDFAHRLG